MGVFPGCVPRGRSLTVNAVDPVDGLADRLAIILTLWLTLYAHKYVVATEIKSDENTVRAHCCMLLAFFV